MRLCIALTLFLVLTACASVRPELDLPASAELTRIAALQAEIQALDPDIIPFEAKRAARIAIRYSHHLARQYEISDSPLVHNLKVNLGLKVRGLCIDWTNDLLTRLRREDFQSLDLHWAIANYETLFRLEHSTVVVSARGASIDLGLVLDPWRHAGRLYWAPTRADSGYRWQPWNEVQARKRLHKTRLARQQLQR